MKTTLQPKFIKSYDEKHQLQIAMPLGGIGAGCVCFNGYGGLQDFSVRNRPDTRAATNGARVAAFALLHVKGAKPVTRLLEGPVPPERIYDQAMQGEGFRQGGHEGIPRFRHSTFRGGYPFGQVGLRDPKIPLRVEVTGWNPFIPGDDVNSGIPCAILEYTFRNTSRKKVDFEFSYHLSHPAPAGFNWWNDWKGTRNGVIPGKGARFWNTEKEDSPVFGSASLTVIGHRPSIKAMWLRGGWFDGLTALWRDAEAGKFVPNDGTFEGESGDHDFNGGSVLVKGSLAPGKAMTVPVVITWHFPNSDLYSDTVNHHGRLPYKKTAGGAEYETRWRNFYVTQWKDAAEVALHVHQHYADLRSRTVAFQRALLDSTLPPEVLDAVSANLAILKSPTVLRMENGNLWGWEGTSVHEGSCHGSCTHVWNYAQAFPQLFPKLERTLREQEWLYSMDETGHTNFRASIPNGPARHDFHAAADGQLGGMMKLYREWQISGDTAWMRKFYPLAKKSLEYCIGKWDPDRRGVLSEPHHNTYDIEFWGPDGMCNTIYIGALSAMAELAHAVDDEAAAADYRGLAEKGALFLDEELFNGDYYEQKVQYKGLRDQSFLNDIARPDFPNKEMLRLLKKEGPRYQYGTGCLSDGVIGAWMARFYGIATPLSEKNVRRNLLAIFRHNFRSSLLDHANLQRPGYALGDEPGLLLCSWPRGGKPILPFVYSDEVWTGIEYQVASHLIEEGYVREGLAIVKAVRKRYEGHVRNPWNEYECGSYYARAMASFALLNSLSGFRYSAVEKKLSFSPKLPRRPFRCFFSTEGAFGTVTLTATKLIVDVIEGELPVEKLEVTQRGKARSLDVSKTVHAAQPHAFALPSS